MNKSYILNIVKLAILLNIGSIGWTIKEIKDNQIIITKKLNSMNDTDHNISCLLNKLINI
jgi:hypothetical protein